MMQTTEMCQEPFEPAVVKHEKASTSIYPPMPLALGARGRTGIEMQLLGMPGTRHSLLDSFSSQ